MLFIYKYGPGEKKNNVLSLLPYILLVCVGTGDNDLLINRLLERKENNLLRIFWYHIFSFRNYFN
jgi:hypothetical protein